MFCREAMSPGKSVFSAGVGGVAEIGTHGLSGLIVDPASPADALPSLSADPAHAERFGLKGGEIVKNGFGVDRTIGNVRAVFAESTPARNPEQEAS